MESRTYTTRHVVYVLDSIHEVGQRLSGFGVDLTQMKDGLDLVVIDLASRVVVPHRLHGVAAKVARHHVEACCPTLIDIGWRVIEVAIKKPLYKCLIEKGICKAVS